MGFLLLFYNHLFYEYARLFFDRLCSYVDGGYGIDCSLLEMCWVMLLSKFISFFLSLYLDPIVHHARTGCVPFMHMLLSFEFDSEHVWAIEAERVS